MNNPRNRVLIFLVVFLLLTNIGMLLYFTMFNHGPHGPHDRQRGPGAGVTAFLQNEDGFTPEQMKRLDSLKDHHRAIIKPLFDELGRSKDHFYQMIGKPNVSDSMLREAAAEIGRRQAALDLQFFQNFMSLRSLCTPEQLPKFDSVMPMLSSKMMQPWKNGSNHRKDSTDNKN